MCQHSSNHNGPNPKRCPTMMFDLWKSRKSLSASRCRCSGSVVFSLVYFCSVALVSVVALEGLNLPWRSPGFSKVRRKGSRLGLFFLDLLFNDLKLGSGNMKCNKAWMQSTPQLLSFKAALTPVKHNHESFFTFQWKKFIRNICARCATTMCIRIALSQCRCENDHRWSLHSVPIQIQIQMSAFNRSCVSSVGCNSLIPSDLLHQNAYIVQTWQGDLQNWNAGTCFRA